jgi:hypothetical protein
MRFLFALVLVGVFQMTICSCSFNESPDLLTDGENTIDMDDVKGENYTYTIFLTDSSDTKKGYCFDILLNDKVFLHQRSFIGLNESRILNDYKSAATVAKYIIFKIESNKNTTILTPKELDSLGIY